MNWALTILFYLIFIPFCMLAGDTVLSWAGYRRTCGRRFAAGFFSWNLVGFAAGCPSLFLHVPWNVYYWFQLAVFVLTGALLVYLRRDTVFCRETYSSLFTAERIRKFFFENWFLIVLVGVLMYLSMANNLPYYRDGYDDVMYIGKMVNMIGAPAIGIEDPYNGNVVETGLITYKIFNTFELLYAFTSETFHIQIIFFCRVTMNLAGYLLFAAVYKEIAAVFVKRSLAQYALLLFFGLVISEGYLLHHFHMYSYDLWRLQTAMFYGGTIARNSALPCLLLFALPLLRKPEWKKFLFVILLSISMTAFSTIYVIEAGFFAIAFLILLAARETYCGISEKKIWKGLIGILLFLLIAAVLAGSKQLDNYPDLTHWSRFNEKYLATEMPSFYSETVFFRYGYVILAFAFLAVRGVKKQLTLGVITICYLFVRFLYFSELALLLGGYQHYAVYRYIASIQYLLVLLTGVLIVKLFRWKPLLNLTCIVFISVVLSYFSSHLDEIVAQHERSDGVCEYGYDFSRPFDLNTAMTPDITFKFGDFFNSLPYGNYRFYAGNYFPYEGRLVAPEVLYISSNRIENCMIYQEYNGMTAEQNELLDAFCWSDDMTYEEIAGTLQDCRVDYFMVYTENAKRELENAGYSVVLQNEPGEEAYYLFAIN